MNRPFILSTRKLTSSNKALAKNSALQWLEEDFIVTNECSFSIDKINDYVLFTSQNAVKSVLNNIKIDLIQQKPAICVGLKTKELLETEGWTVVAWAHYADELVEIIRAKFQNVAFTFFAGNLRREVLPGFFRANKIDFDEFEVYQTLTQSHEIKQELDGICFYSPSGVESYLQQNRIQNEVCFCIGTTTAAALEGITTNIVLVQQPTIESTIETCIAYYK